MPPSLVFPRLFTAPLALQLFSRLSRLFAVCAVPVVLQACAPALDWRDVRPANARVQGLFPCKPQIQDRRVQLAGEEVRLLLHACTADGQTWALAHADLADPARIGRALKELSASAASNIGAAATEGEALQVPGATPNVSSRHSRLQGVLPDGRRVQMQVAVFVHGTTVFQATVLGEQVAEEPARTFFSGLRFRS